MRKAAGLAAAVLLAACSESMTVPRRGITPDAATLSIAAGRSAATPTDRHFFLMHGNSIPAGFAAEVAAAGGTVVRVHPEIGMVLVRGLTDGAASRLARGNGWVEREVRFRGLPTLQEFGGALLLNGIAPAVPAPPAKPPQSATLLQFQWHMHQIHAVQAWTSRPLGDRAVRVAIIDSGLDPDHVDQAGLIDVASSRAFTPSASSPPDWADDMYHGTYVGGLVVTNNVNLAGVAPAVTLIAIKVFTAGGETTGPDVIAGILHAANVRADVANLSLGAYFPKSGVGLAVAAFNRAVNYANQHDVLIVSASGNENIDLQHDQNQIMVPCESGTGMCVSATGPGDLKSSFSNYGVPAIHVAAPGGEAVGNPVTHWVHSLCSSRSIVPPLSVACKSKVGILSAYGTSGAAPHVSGLAAYLDAQYSGALNPAQLQTTLEQCSDDIGKPGTDPFFGHGRINAFKTVNEVDCDKSKPAATDPTGSLR